MTFPFQDTDFFEYFPLKGGKIPVSSPKINKLPFYDGKHASIKNAILQKDQMYQYTIDAKRKLNEKAFAAIKEDVDYYDHLADHLLGIDSSAKLNGDIYDIREFFSRTQEDAILLREKDGKNYVSSVYLGCPNDWSAQSAVGKSFEEAHAHIKDLNKKIPNVSKLFKVMLNSDHMFERVGAINFRVSPSLNRIDSIPDDIRCKNFNPNFPSLWCRFERQVTIPLHNIDSLLLTIKTYQFNCKHPDPEKREDIIKAITDLNPKIHAYDYLSRNKEEILKWLKS